MTVPPRMRRSKGSAWSDMATPVGGTCWRGSAEVTGDAMLARAARGSWRERRLLLAAHRLGERAAGVEAAAARRPRRAGRIAREQRALGAPSRIGLRRGSEQDLGVGMARRREQRVAVG